MNPTIKDIYLVLSTSRVKIKSVKKHYSYNQGFFINYIIAGSRYIRYGNDISNLELPIVFLLSHPYPTAAPKIYKWINAYMPKITNHIFNTIYKDRGIEKYYAMWNWRL